ncbi:MAG: DUF1592 domain-containing protein [Fuerstiella sp.]|nr:DUF1592 domain-containing protein [Fuerstiella sp.]
MSEGLGTKQVLRHPSHTLRITTGHGAVSGSLELCRQPKPVEYVVSASCSTLCSFHRIWHINWKWVAITICFVTAAIQAAAQEESEDVREIGIELRHAQREKRHLQKRLELTSERIELLTESRTLRRALERFERRILEVRKTDDERRVEQLVDDAEEAELELEFVHAKLEMLERRGSIVDLISDLEEAELETLLAEATLLSGMPEQGSELLKKLFQVYRDGPEREAGELEQKIKELEERFYHQREVLQLRLELHWARIEGEADDVRDLEAELTALAASVEFADDDDSESRSVNRRQDLLSPVQLSVAEVSAAGRLDLHRQIIPLLKSVCFDCHAGDSVSGDLDLSVLVNTTPLIVNRSHWINVIQQLKVRSMPPADAKQPSDADRRTLTAWLTNAIENFDYSTVRQPGYEPARRLTHVQYNNTIRDLTGIDLRPADRFPVDMTATSGFRNSANSLFVQPILMERYVGAAEAIVADAWPVAPESREQKTAWRTLLGNVQDLSASGAAENVLQRFATRAYRRPVERDELTSLLSYFEQRVRDGVSAEAALADVLQAILVSPNFLIRSERAGPEADVAFSVTDWELAGRLSYFLWASMPDDELFALAKTRQLRQPGVLSGQVDRMLADPKAGTLGTLFAAQWLGFTDLDRVRPGQIDNPWATDSLIESMKQESAMLFNSLVQNDHPIDRLVDADYTFVNEELARHYRMKGVSGEHMRRVSLQDTPRRGVLGHGSILAVTSFPGRTSPVLRGNWILTRLLGTPPPPPPPNVSEFDERIAENRRLTQRQKLESHRDNANCYACHSLIDPLGFALQEFEWFGRHQPTRQGKPVDATGRLPQGKSFRGLTGLSQTLLSERLDDLTIQLTRKILSYALGRQLEYYDEATVRDLVQQLQQGDRRLRAVVHAIVQSDAFQMKQMPRM